MMDMLKKSLTPPEKDTTKKKEREGGGERERERRVSVSLDVSPTHQQFLVQLLALSGDLLGVLELLEHFGRFNDLLRFGQGLLKRFGCYTKYHGCVTDDVSLRSSQRAHRCGQVGQGDSSGGGGDGKLAEAAIIGGGEDDEDRGEGEESDDGDDDGDDGGDDDDDDDGDDDRFGDTWVTTGDEDGDADADADAYGDGSSVGVAQGTSSLNVNTSDPPQSSLPSAEPCPLLSAPAISAIRIHYAALVRHTLFAAIYLNDLAGVAVIHEDVVWEYCLTAQCQSQRQRQSVRDEDKKMLQKRLLLLEVRLQVQRRRGRGGGGGEKEHSSSGEMEDLLRSLCP
jgi:hypothetical protein